jgi:hypothetical protein
MGLIPSGDILTELITCKSKSPQIEGKKKLQISSAIKVKADGFIFKNSKLT